MILKDDRTPEQRKTHTVIVMMTDRFMSGWGEASGGPSYAGWAVVPADLSAYFHLIHNRSDARNVRVVRLGDERLCQHHPLSRICFRIAASRMRRLDRGKTGERSGEEEGRLSP